MCSRSESSIAVDERERVADGLLGELRDVQPADRDRQALGAQPVAACTSRHGISRMNCSSFSRWRVGVGLGVPPLDVREHPLVGGVVRALAVVPVLVADVDLLVRAVEDHVARAPSGASSTACRARTRAPRPPPRARGTSTPACCWPTARCAPSLIVRSGSGTTSSASTSSRDPEPVARLARAVRRVEREVPGRELVERQPAERARERLREVLDLLAAVVRLDRDRRDALGELERGLDRVGDAAADVGLGDQAVDDDLDRVLVVLRQADRLGELAHLAVDPGAREPLPRQVAEQLLVLALAPPDHRAPAPGTSCPPAAPSPGRRSARASGGRSGARSSCSADGRPGRRAPGGSRRPR